MNGHPVTVQYYDRPEEIKTCHILFSNTAEIKNPAQVIAGFRKRSMLTVSDDINFSKYGGMIRFFTSDNKIRLRINVEATKAAGLSISSKLLRLAEIYNPAEKNN